MTVLTAANQLTLLRLMLVPVFALCMLYGLPGWALVTFVVASATELPRARDSRARRPPPSILTARIPPTRSRAPHRRPRRRA